MNKLKNYFHYVKLSVISLVSSLIILNLSLNFFDIKKSLIITIVLVFIINFYNLQKYYKFRNNLNFLIFLIIIKLCMRLVEYHLFLIVFNEINSHNFSWILVITFTHFLKFLSIQIYDKLFKKKNS